MCLMAAFCTASAEQILPRDSVQRNCFKLALYTTRNHDCISNRIGSGIRTCPRCGCRLATFGALPTPSTIYRAIIILNNHRFWGHASGPSSSGKTLSSFHPLLARPCRSALPRERFSPLALIGRHSRTQECLLLGEERKSRLRHPTSESDPGCVKTRLSQERLELFSQLPFASSTYPCDWFPQLRNRVENSTRKFSVRVFTQPGPHTGHRRLKSATGTPAGLRNFGVFWEL